MPPVSPHFSAVIIATFALSALAVPQVTGAELAKYNFSTSTTVDENGVATNGTTSYLTVDTDTNSKASVFTGGAGFIGTIPAGASTGTSSNAGSSHLFIRVGATDSADQTDKAGAITANDYYTFSLAPNSGFTLNLTSLTFDLLLTGDTFEGTVFLRSNVDGYAADLFSLTTTGTAAIPASFSAGGGARGPVNFGSEFSSLADPVTFRFYFADNSSATGAGVTFRVDNVVVNGTTAAVPEPASGLLALGGAGLMLARWRRR